MGSPLASRMKVAVIQLFVGTEKRLNIQRAQMQLVEAHAKGAQLIVLPVH